MRHLSNDIKIFHTIYKIIFLFFSKYQSCPISNYSTFDVKLENSKKKIKAHPQ